MLETFLSYTISGEPFRLFSLSHLVVLLLFAAGTWALYFYRRKLRASSMKETMRHTLAATLLLTELAFQFWHVWTQTWSTAYTLPLQLCSVSLLLCVVMLYSKSYALYEVTFFAGVGGALQAMLTPELFYPFPHFRFLHFFLAHACIIWACLYMTWVEKYQPTLRSVWKTMVFLNLLLVIALLVNRWTGGNYLFVSRKPDNPSLIDYLGAYPWYIISLEGVAIVMFLLLYLPFAASGRKSSASPTSRDFSS
ncbi:hypothetical protein T458_17060 [Brevibacillus panacihumi W25]|uniref:ABC transporter permease n=1 Tax=Brevibacillus panacihumi W25 TaxID=1408254 RepID=V6MBD5_9BACL|nr:TIGR02206 family membrane protein [Brevibacillus panacihumi]EST52668.1 hypothetical protein T458_17060 [Brevibacillus panacihumi W25]